MTNTATSTKTTECNQGIATIQKPHLQTYLTDTNWQPSTKSGKTPNSRILLKNAHIIDPESNTEIKQNGELVIEDGFIAEVSEGGISSQSSSDSFTEVVDCEGNLVTPGLVDIQVHFRDPGATHKEDLTTGSLSAIAGGVTSVVCQPNTSPTLDSKFALDYLYYKSKQEAYCDIYAYASLTCGLEGEILTDMQALATHPIVCGFTDDGLPLVNSNLMRKSFELSKITKKVVAQHAEDRLLSQGGCMNEGLTSARLGVIGIPNASESIIVERDIALLKKFGGKYHVLHVSTKEALDAIKKAKEEGLNITCEVSPHHLTLDDRMLENYNTNAKMNPPLRSEQDVEALQQALKEGVFDAVATDHAPHDYKSKNTSLAEAAFGVVGLETLLPTVLKFYHNNSLTLKESISLLTNKPANALGLNAGRLQKSKTANIAIINLNKDWTVSTEKFLSKSKNSPFNDQKMKGINIMTFVSGTKVFDALSK